MEDKGEKCLDNEWARDLRDQCMGAMAMVLAVSGAILNNRLDDRCFYVFICSNAICGHLHWKKRMWWLVVRDVIFTVLAIIGIFMWKVKGV